MDLAEAGMNVQPSREQLKHLFDEMLPKYQEYCTTVSQPGMAVSLETMIYIRWLCEQTAAKRVADLGSGYSSYVLRQYQAAHPGVEVLSVDDSSEWLDKTAGWLKANDLPTDGLIGPDEWLAGVEPFDVILHDYAGGERREEFMAAAAARLAPGGFLIFDDAQHESHQTWMVKTAGECGLELFGLFDQTIDKGGRYAILAHRPVPVPLADRYAELCATPSDIFLHLPRFVALVEELDAQHVIELGSRSGVSTVAWLYALESTGGSLTSVDLDYAPLIGTWGHWRHIQGDDLDPDVIAQLEPADIVFIDTSHALEQTRRELETYLPLVKRPGLLVLHDTELAQPQDAPLRDGVFPVKRAVKEFVRQHGFECEWVTECFGLAIVKVV